MVKSNLNTTIKKFKNTLIAKDFAKAEELFKEVVSMLNNAAKDNLHKNNASRKQAHFAKLLHDAKMQNNIPNKSTNHNTCCDFFCD